MEKRRPGIFGWSLGWLLLLVLLLPFLYAFAFLFPRGDDFDEVTRAMFLFDLPGGLYEVGREWLTWSGRYSYHFLAVFLGKAGELRAVYGLVCAAALTVYGLAVYGLARLSGSGRDRATFCGALGVLILLCCHQNLQTFYMLTDALTMGLQAGAALCFVWAACRLWLAPEAQMRKARRMAVLIGVLTVGIYEHSALAVAASVSSFLWLAWLGWRRAKAQASGGTGMQGSAGTAARLATARLRLRHFLILGLWCHAAMLFSFLAPGNFQRKAVRGISHETQWRQLGGACREWLDSAFWFFDGLWPWAVLLLVLLLRCALPCTDGTEQGAAAQARRVDRAGACWLMVTVALAYLGLTAGLTLLHALSDVTISSSSKLPAGLGVYAACAFGFVLWAGMDLLPAGAQNSLRKLPLWLLLMPLLAVPVLSRNWLDTACNAANGAMPALARSLSQRYAWLEAQGAAAASSGVLADASPKFGLAGEIFRPGARQRRIDPALPQAVVQQLYPASVFPVHMDEPLPGSPEVWPNLWVAWLYGVGSVRSASPNPAAALAPASSATDPGSCTGPVPLAVPGQLRDLGLEEAWLMQAQGGPNPTFANTWLVLRAVGTLPERIAILRLNPPDWQRLLPLPAQHILLERLERRSSLEADLAVRLAGQRLDFDSRDWQAGSKLYAFPVAATQPALAALFFSPDQQRFYRLDRREVREPY